jgi:hypothetical protein
LPLHEVEPDGSVRSLLSGERHSITVRKKTVDAAYLTNAIPKTHTRKFEVAEGVTCIPPNDLPQLCTSFKRFTVLGAGKTGLDACGWLLEHGAPADAIRWIMPRDSWFLNRATTQPGEQFFAQTFGAFAAGREAMAQATSATDYAHRMEAAGAWLRLDRGIEPRMFHGATVSEGELAELRRIRDVVRLGRVRRIEPNRLQLEASEMPAAPDTLYIDCTAGALSRPPTKPVFDGARITLQMVRYPQFAFSAALIGFLEASLETDAEKNAFAAPLRIPDTVEESLTQTPVDNLNRDACNRHPLVREWVTASRTEGFRRLMSDVKPTDTEKLRILDRLRKASKAAALNLPALLATLPRDASLKTTE